MTCSSHIVKRPGRPPVGALRELRGPLVALAVIALVFQFALPTVTAKAGPGWQTALSICLGNGDDGQDRSDHSGACACGPSCAHGGCGGCGFSDRTVVAVDHPDFGLKFQASEQERSQRVFSGYGVTRSRAPPVAA